MSVAFEEHLLKAHKPGQTSEDASQAAVRIVREATEREGGKSGGVGEESAILFKVENVTIACFAGS
jgi:20S proteasome alpha/beta subunit